MLIDSKSTFNEVNVGTYAVALARVIRKDFSATQQRNKNIKDFSDLHDYCDANEYFLAVDYKLGWEGREMTQSYFDFISTAAELVFVFLNGEVSLRNANVLSSF